MDYAHTVNAETDISPGCASMAEISFSVLGDATANIFAGRELTYQYTHASGDAPAYVNGGIFTVYEVKKQNEKTTVRARDNMSKFDIDVTDWLNGLTYPITLSNMLTSLCSRAGVTRAAGSITNSSFSVRRNIDAANVTGRDILGWITQLAAAFAYMGENGQLYLASYADRGAVLDNTKYVKFTRSEFSVDPIDRVQLRSGENDIGVIVGSGENTLDITNNPLVYADSDAQIRPAAQAVYNVVSAIRYTPFEITLFDDFGISAGDIITVNGERTLVMSKRMQASGVTLTASGNKRREVQSSAQNIEITRLRGRTNELTRTVEQTTSRLTSAEGDISSLEQTAASLTVSVSTANGNISSLQQTAAGLTTRVTTAEGNISTVTQTAGKINWLVQSGTSSSNFTLTPRTIDLVAQNINLTGYVTFNDLLMSGRTTINGDNITTGRISANYIGANNGQYITFNSPLYLNSTYPQIYGLNALYFGAPSSSYAPHIRGGDQNVGASSVRIYADSLTRSNVSGGTAYTILDSGNWSNYISGITAVFG